MGPGALLNRLLGPTRNGGECFGKPLAGSGVAGIQGEGFSELDLATGKVPTVFHLAATQDRVRVGERGIKLQRLLRRSIRFGYGVVGVTAIVTQSGIGVSQ